LRVLCGVPGNLCAISELAGELVGVPACGRAWRLGDATRSRAPFIFPVIEFRRLAMHLRRGILRRAGAALPMGSRATGLHQGRGARVARGIVTQWLLLATVLQRNAAGGLLITTSTRRFCCRPLAESLSATGSLGPLPEAESRTELIPCAVR